MKELKEVKVGVTDVGPGVLNYLYCSTRAWNRRSLGFTSTSNMSDSKINDISYTTTLYNIRSFLIVIL